MNSKPLSSCIKGHSPDRLSRNLRVIQSRWPNLFEELQSYLTERTLHVSSSDHGECTVRICDASANEIHAVRIPPPSVFPPPIAARYRAYNPNRTWLIVFGIEAFFPNRLKEMPIAESTPVVLIESDPGVFLAWAAIRSYEERLTLPHTHAFIHPYAPQQFVESMSATLKPYFAYNEGFFLIPSPRCMQNGPVMAAFTQSAQKEFASQMRR